MCILLEKAKKDFDVVKTMQAVDDELYLDICCYHTEQAIEKILKCSIEMRGNSYHFTHNISVLYDDYIASGWQNIDILELMAGTITDWEASSRYKDSFYATKKQLAQALKIYQQLEERLLNYLESVSDKI